MTLGQLRSVLYLAGRVLGDVQAIRRGTVGKRLARRVAGKVTGRALGRMILR